MRRRGPEYEIEAGQRVVRAAHDNGTATALRGGSNGKCRSSGQTPAKRTGAEPRLEPALKRQTGCKTARAEAAVLLG